MAISSIISFGFGNGTFTPGVGKLPTLGYSAAAAIVIFDPDASVETAGYSRTVAACAKGPSFMSVGSIVTP